MKKSQTKIDSLVRQYQAAEASHAIEQASLQSLHDDAAALREVQSIVQRISQELQQTVHQQICAVVTACLAAIFPNPYAFRIDFVSKRGRTEAVPIFERDGLTVDPIDAAGGGVVDIAAFALRLASVVSSMPQCRRVLILDEPWKHVSVALRPKVARMLETLSEQMKVQIIITTHYVEFELGHVVRLDV